MKDYDMSFPHILRISFVLLHNNLLGVIFFSIWPTADADDLYPICEQVAIQLRFPHAFAHHFGFGFNASRNCLCSSEIHCSFELAILSLPGHRFSP